MTGRDLDRLSEGALRVEQSVELLPTEEIDIEGEPESVVWLREGRRVLVLRHRSHPEGSGCMYLTEAGCTIHSHRPAACRAYPFDRPDRTRSPGVHPALVCPDETGVHLPLHDEEARGWVNAVEQRDREAHEYCAWLRKWNLRQQSRVRLGKALLSWSDFLQALVNRSSHSPQDVFD